jgi:hypothetical protein
MNRIRYAALRDRYGVSAAAQRVLYGPQAEVTSTAINVESSSRRRRAESTSLHPSECLPRRGRADKQTTDTTARADLAYRSQPPPEAFKPLVFAHALGGLSGRHNVSPESGIVNSFLFRQSAGGKLAQHSGGKPAAHAVLPTEGKVSPFARCARRACSFPFLGEDAIVRSSRHRPRGISVRRIPSSNLSLFLKRDLKRDPCKARRTRPA